MPYFDLRPKNSRENLYDRESELNALLESIDRCRPLILLLGLRRTGKTSLLNVALRESRAPSVIVDCRVFEEKNSISHREFLEYFVQRINGLLNKHRSLARFFEYISGIELSGLHIELKKPRGGELLLSQILESLDRWARDNNECVIIGLDEAQELVKLRGIRLLPVIAHAYDYLRNTMIIVTGSQIGFTNRFLRLDNPDSPLYGRARVNIVLKPFSHEQSIEFLEKGFNEYDMHPSRDVLEEVVEKLGGIPGWLTMYGYHAVINREYNGQLLERILEEASRIVLKEYKNFLETRPLAAKRYTIILKAVAEGYNEWSKIKRYLELEEGKKISDSIFTQLLRNLVDAGFLEKTSKGYRIPDPVLAYAIRRYRPMTRHVW